MNEHRTPGRFICLEYPLRPNFLAQVVIPRDFTAEEANKLSAFIQTLAVPQEPRK